MKKTTKLHNSTFILILCLLVGLSLLLYPSISNYWNQMYSTHSIAVYSERTEELTDEEYNEIWETAKAYNDGIHSLNEEHYLNDSDKNTYEDILNLDGEGTMGYIEIPALQIELPICHGTSDEVLQKGVGHVEWSSLPVGGSGTHCVLSSHRGLPRARLFTDLDKLELKDVFVIHILKEVLTYEVDQILIVEPEDTSALTIEEGKDYCTLLTCTPYGINSHRLLVRGHRIENFEEDHTTTDAIVISPLIIAPLLALPLLVIILVILLMMDRRKSYITTEEERDETE